MKPILPTTLFALLCSSCGTDAVEPPPPEPSTDPVLMPVPRPVRGKAVVEVCDASHAIPTPPLAGCVAFPRGTAETQAKFEGVVSEVGSGEPPDGCVSTSVGIWDWLSEAEPGFDDTTWIRVLTDGGTSRIVAVRTPGQRVPLEEGDRVAVEFARVDLPEESAVRLLRITHDGFLVVQMSDQVSMPVAAGLTLAVGPAVCRSEGDDCLHIEYNALDVSTEWTTQSLAPGTSEVLAGIRLYNGSLTTMKQSADCTVSSAGTGDFIVAVATKRPRGR